MTGLLLFATLYLATPKEGACLPPISRTYVLGATDPGVTNVVVQGRSVAVHPLGGWVAMADLVPGWNNLVVEGAGTVVTGRVHVATKSAPGEEPPAPVYRKLPYAADEPTTNRARIVVLDPGHGGDSTGAMSPHALPEKDANLRLAKAVKKELEGRGFTVFMTRTDDRDVPLADRPRLAHEVHAAAFVSLHHNAPGLERDPREVRFHAVYAWNVLGEALATAINARMGEALEGALENRGVIHANFLVTRNPEIPSCLVEADFLTTPEAELDVWNRERRKNIAAAIASGIATWLDT